MRTFLRLLYPCSSSLSIGERGRRRPDHFTKLPCLKSGPRRARTNSSFFNARLTCRMEEAGEANASVCVFYHSVRGDSKEKPRVWAVSYRRSGSSRDPAGAAQGWKGPRRSRPPPDSRTGRGGILCSTPTTRMPTGPGPSWAQGPVMPWKWDEMQWPPPWRRSPRWSRNRRARAHFRNPRVESDTWARVEAERPRGQGYKRTVLPHATPTRRRVRGGGAPPPSPRPASPTSAAGLGRRAWMGERHWNSAPGQPLSAKLRSTAGPSGTRFPLRGRHVTGSSLEEAEVVCVGGGGGGGGGGNRNLKGKARGVGKN